MVTAAWAALTAALFAAALAVHQAGHAAAFADLGVTVTRPRIGFPLRGQLTPDQAGAMTYRQAAWYTASGVLANIVLGLVLLAGWWLLRGALLPALITGAVAAGVWVFRYWVALALVPAAGLLVLATEVLGMTAVPRGVPAQILLARSPSGALLTAAVASLSVALFCMLPVSPLDGHRMAAAVTRAWPGRGGAIYARAATWITAAVIAAAILSGVLRLISA